MFCFFSPRRTSERLERPPSSQPSVEEEGNLLQTSVILRCDISTKSRRSFLQQIPENYTPPAPITAPIMAPLGADPQAKPVSSVGPQAMVQGPYSGVQQMPPPSMNPAMPKTSTEGAPGAPTGDLIQVRSHLGPTASSLTGFFLIGRFYWSRLSLCSRSPLRRS